MFHLRLGLAPGLTQVAAQPTVREPRIKLSNFFTILKISMSPIGLIFALTLEQRKILHEFGCQFHREVKVQNEIERLFGELVELSAVERKQRLDEVFVESPEVHAQLLPLLQAHDQAGSFLRLAGESTAEFDGADQIGKQIRQYKLREMIGEGGMGVGCAEK